MGNTPGGDDVVNFHVNTAPEPMSFDPSSGYQMTLPTRLSYPEVLGVLFPDEIQAGITLTRNADQSRTAPVAGDQFEFHILQSNTYSFILSCDDIPPGTQLLGLTDGAGNPASYTLDQNNEVLTAYLYPGTYLLNVGGWDPRMAQTVAYQIRLSLPYSSDNPPALVSGPCRPWCCTFQARPSRR